MSSATNSHNYLYENWTRGVPVQSVLMDQFSDQHVCRFHVVTTAVSKIFASENYSCTFRVVTSLSNISRDLYLLSVEATQSVLFKSTRGLRHLNYLKYHVVCQIPRVAHSLTLHRLV